MTLPSDSPSLFLFLTSAFYVSLKRHDNAFNSFKINDEERTSQEDKEHPWPLG